MTQKQTCKYSIWENPELNTRSYSQLIFDKNVKNYTVWKASFSEMVLRNLDTYMQTNKIIPKTQDLQKNVLKYTKDFKPQNFKNNREKPFKIQVQK